MLFRENLRQFLTFVFLLLASVPYAPSSSDLEAWQKRSQSALPPVPSHSFLPMPERRSNSNTFYETKNTFSNIYKGLRIIWFNERILLVKIPKTTWHCYI